MQWIPGRGFYYPLLALTPAAREDKLFLEVHASLLQRMNTDEVGALLRHEVRQTAPGDRPILAML
jgi:hypothetical protein